MKPTTLTAGDRVLWAHDGRQEPATVLRSSNLQVQIRVRTVDGLRHPWVSWSELEEAK